MYAKNPIGASSNFRNKIIKVSSVKIEIVRNKTVIMLFRTLGGNVIARKRSN